MAWESFAPPIAVKSSGKPMVSISLKEKKDGSITGTIVLADTYLTFGDNLDKAISIDVGTEDNAGMLRFRFDEAGSFKAFTRIPRGGARLTFAAPDFFPRDTIGMLSCRSIAQDDESFTIQLPLEQWADHIAAKKRVADRASKTPTLAPQVAAPTIDLTKESKLAPFNRKVDPIAYLTKKGHRIMQLAGGRWSMDGENVMTTDVVQKINSYRTRESLSPITATEFTCV